MGSGAAAVAGRSALHPDPLHPAALGSGVAALALGIAALWAETNEVLLALFILAIVVTWTLGEIAHVRGSVAAGRSMAHHA